MKKYLLGLLTGILLMGTVSAVLLYNASEIEFNSNNKDFDVDNVGDAINTLYGYSKNISGRIDGTHARSVYYGGRVNGQTSLELTKGNYYVFVAYATAWTSVNDMFHDTKDMTNTEIIRRTMEFSNMNCETISIESNRQSAPEKSFNYKSNLSTYEMIYKCNVQNTGSIKVKYDTGDVISNIYPYIVSINSIKIDEGEVE